VRAALDCHVDLPLAGRDLPNRIEEAVDRQQQTCRDDHAGSQQDLPLHGGGAGYPRLGTNLGSDQP
jgi:hypothetical protein